jgi:ribonuclease T1
MRYWFAVFLVVLCTAWMPLNALGKEPLTGVIQAIALSELPHEGRSVYKQIHAGIPFTHEKDGSVFGNRERLLPLQKRGFYREYTVRTPWVKSRGARRIVCGGLQVSMPDICYYTADHYASFRKIVP